MLFALGLLLSVRILLAAPAMTCPKTFGEWSQWREKLLAVLNDPADLADGRAKALFDCRAQADQKVFFDDPKFAACMNPLQQTVEAITAVRKNSITNPGTASEVVRAQGLFVVLCEQSTKRPRTA